MNGKILADTPIAVDCWQLRKCHHVRLFFLSHMHADHTAGLSSTWSHRPIYCSPLTARLLHRKLGVKEKWICPLELGESHMLMLDDLGKERLVVTLIDANHCPGAVMFLFEGYFGTRLYTGDFRYTPAMLREQCLRNNTTIDVLYLDNTNCDPTRAVPSRQRATQQIKEIIRTHPGHVVVFGLYSLGKESLLVELAMEFKSWVEVDVDRLETLRVLGLPDVFTTEPGSGRFRVVTQSEVNGSNLLAWNKEQPTIAILPTSRPIVSCHRNVHVVPYSDHSSYQELEDFVSALRPSSMVPIVGSCLPYFSSLLSPCKKTKKVYIPESVKLYMTRSDVHYMAGVKQSLPGRSTCSESRGVVFESPLSKLRRGPDDLDSDDSEADHNSDCILSDLTPDSSRAMKRLKLTSVASEDVVTLSSCVSPDDESHDDESELLEVVTSRIKKVSNGSGLHVGSAVSREKCCSMDSISTHDQNGHAASTLPEKKSRSAWFTLTLRRDQLEQWLLNNITAPEEELKCEQVMQGLQEEFPLMPDHHPKPPCDPLEAAIRRLL